MSQKTIVTPEKIRSMLDDNYAQFKKITSTARNRGDDNTKLFVSLVNALHSISQSKTKFKSGIKVSELLIFAYKDSKTPLAPGQILKFAKTCRLYMLAIRKCFEKIQKYPRPMNIVAAECIRYYKYDLKKRKQLFKLEHSNWKELAEKRQHYRMMNHSNQTHETPHKYARHTQMPRAAGK